MNTVNILRESIEDSFGDLSNIQFVAFDTETTGLSPVVARLVELSGVKFNLQTREFSEFSSLIDPEIRIPPEATAVHGITQSMVSGKPKFDEVVGDFFDWVGSADTVLVAHNARFDVGFLRYSLEKMNRKMPDNLVLDTLPLCRQLLVDAPNNQLRTVVQHLELPEGGYHRALADSHHVRNMISVFAKRFEEVRVWDNLLSMRCLSGFNSDGESEALIPHSMKENFSTLKSAIKDQISIAFKYSTYPKRERLVKPLSVAQNKGNFYLTAFCMHVEDERTFRLDKITNLRTLESAVALS